MAETNKPTKRQKQTAQTLLTEMEAMPTMKMQRLSNGMVLGVEKDSVWVYFKVPTGPVADAKDTAQLDTAYKPMFTMFNEIAKATPPGAIKKRSVSKSAYRNVHLLRINVPSRWKANDTFAPADRRHAQERLNKFLYDQYPPKIVSDSILCFGVKLDAKTTGSGLRQAWDSILFTLVEGGIPLIDYLADLDKVKGMAARAGLTELSDKEIRKLDAWWNSGDNPDVVTLTHPDHMHLFRDHRSVRAAENAGPSECEDWPEDMPGHRIISFGALEDLEVEFESAYQPAANWLLPALQSGALAVSVRGQIEPQKLTREAIRSNRRQYLSDIQERQQQNKLSRAEEQERFQELTAVEGEYGAGGGTPTLMNASVLAAFDGQVEDFEVIDRGLASWLCMEFRQDKAWAEMMMASVRKANPYLLDMPVQNIAASGINSVSKVGDRYGVLRGFTENDQVPSYYSPEAAYGLAERSPTGVVVAGSGSGKAIAIANRVKTPGQSTSMGDLKVGDTILDRAESPCTVTSVHEVPNPELAFEITFSDGQKITADANHQWVVTGGPRLDPKGIEVSLLWGKAPERLDPESAVTVLRHSDEGLARWIVSAESLRHALIMVDVHPGADGLYDTEALRRGILDRARQIALGTPNLLEEECVLSTGEMLALMQDGQHKGFGLRRLATTEEHPEEVLYIRDGGITPVDPVPMRCITVDSPDSTYLIEGNIPTHNTMLLQWEAYQTAMLGYDQIVVDPKALRLQTPIPTPWGWTTMGELSEGDQVIGGDGVPCTVTHKSEVFQPDEITMYEIQLDDGERIRADAEHQWVVATPDGRSAITNGDGPDADQLMEWAKCCRELADSIDASFWMNTGQLIEELKRSGVQRWTQPQQLVRDLERVDSPRAKVRIQGNPRYFYEPVNAVTNLASQLREEAARGTMHLQAVTTRELRERKDTRKGTRGYFAIPMTKPVELPEQDLPVAPYLLGAWLGDGVAKNHLITVGKSDSEEMLKIVQRYWPSARLTDGGHVDYIVCGRDTSICLYGHDAYETRTRGDRSGEQSYCHTCDEEYHRQWDGAGSISWGDREKVNPSLHHLLRQAGVLGNKHIPEQYLRGSVHQRLELLRGLMDTDGTVHVERGQCKIGQSNPELADQILALVRSLGIKATTTVEASSYRNDDGELVRCRDSHGVVFQTDLPVFQLPRKRDIQPEAGFRSKWRYINDIVEVESEAAQCIRVDSPDHTYLAGEGFTVTHNTGSDLTPVFGAIPGAQIFSLDELAKADGAFDPLTFSESPEIGIPYAVDAIRKCDPYASDDLSGQMEPTLNAALTWAVNNGATATLQGLRMANDAGEFPDEHMRKVEQMAGSYATFRAMCGSGESESALGKHRGTTLIKVGSGGLKLPNPGNPPQSQLEKINITLVKNVIFAATAALNHRKGVLRLDEAWVFTSNDPEGLDQLARLARSQTIDITLYTQKISDALDIGLENFISRGAIMHIAEEEEAAAACKLMRIEPTPERLSRIMNTGMIGDDEGTPDGDSLKPLKVLDPSTGEEKVIRGSIAYYMDINSRVVPVEIDIPERFVKIASTNIDDIEERSRQASTG